MTNKTIDELSTDIKWIMKKLDEIHDQTKLTNGRLRTLEVWKATLMGKVSGVSLAFSIFIPFVFDFLKKIFTN